jgi:hypothetical protein
MEGFIDRTCARLNVAITPRVATDLNTIKDYQRESVLIHTNRTCCEDVAVRQDRILRGD